MAEENADLFNAFAEDHAFLGKSFYELSQALRSNDVAAARRLATHLDRDAGAHIAFEEENFYPTLAGLVDENEVETMLHEHQEGLSLVQQLCDLSPGTDLSDDQRKKMLRRSEAMERHIAECGNLFEAMGRLTSVEQEELHEELIQWRLQRPSWRRHAAAFNEKKASSSDIG